MTKTITLGGPYFEMGIQAVLIQFEDMTAGLVIGYGSHQVALEKFALTHGIRIHLNLLDITNKDLRDGPYDGSIAYKGTVPVCIQYLMILRVVPCSDSVLFVGPQTLWVCFCR